MGGENSPREKGTDLLLDEHGDQLRPSYGGRSRFLGRTPSIIECLSDNP